MKGRCCLPRRRPEQRARSDEGGTMKGRALSPALDAYDLSHGRCPAEHQALSLKPFFDVIVVGAGHAGCEAAWAVARLGLSVGLCTLSRETVAHMPCNPAIGGTAKGDRKSTRLNSSHANISYAVFC